MHTTFLRLTLVSGDNLNLQSTGIQQVRKQLHRASYTAGRNAIKLFKCTMQHTSYLTSLIRCVVAACNSIDSVNKD